MKTSINGLSLIRQEEGFKSKVYKDIKGIPTIGIGHRVLSGETFSESGITEEEALAILSEDVAFVEIFLNSKGISFTQNEFDALVDFGFNLGIGSLGHLLSHGFSQIPNQIVLWDHAGAVRVPALTRRRNNELKLFVTPGLVSISFNNESEIIITPVTSTNNFSV